MRALYLTFAPRGVDVQEYFDIGGEILNHPPLAIMRGGLKTLHVIGEKSENGRRVLHHIGVCSMRLSCRQFIEVL